MTDRNDDLRTYALRHCYATATQLQARTEQNSAYFFGLEKYHGKFSLIQQLNINDTVTDNPNSIAVFCSDFYRNLYKSKYCHQSTTTFLNSLIDTSISQDERKFCDDPITLQEITFAIEHCKTNKSPGVDGLSAEFYQAFTQDLAPFLLEVILESVEKVLYLLH